MEAFAFLAQETANIHDRALWSGAHKTAWIIHVIGIILWVGGLLLLTRLLGYHMKEVSRTNGEGDFQEALFRIEKRMHWLVVVPGLALAVGGGLWALVGWNMPNMKMGWFHAKLTIAVIFAGLQLWTILTINKLAADPPKKKTPVFSIIHGCAGLLLIAVLFLVRFRPF
jgi:putative membrane protein